MNDANKRQRNVRMCGHYPKSIKLFNKQSQVFIFHRTDCLIEAIDCKYFLRNSIVMGEQTGSDRLRQLNVFLLLLLLLNVCTLYKIVSIVASNMVNSANVTVCWFVSRP